MIDIKSIDEAIWIASAVTGTRGNKSVIRMCFGEDINKHHRIWTKEEENFVQNNYGRICDEDIAKHIGRSITATKIHIKRELHLSSILKDSKILTAEHVANGLGVDSKTIHLLMDTGRMPCRRLPFRRNLRSIDKITFLKWILDKENWLYFKPSRVGNLFNKGKRRINKYYDFAFWEDARRILLKSYNKNKNYWLSVGQVSRLLHAQGGGTRYINKAIHKKTLKAKRWGNWWIRKADFPAGRKTINFKGDIVTLQKV